METSGFLSLASSLCSGLALCLSVFFVSKLQLTTSNSGFCTRAGMAAAGTRESWDAGGLTFSQPVVGNGGAEADDVWDDGAILKAFDDALSTHTRKPVDAVEARKWNKHVAQGPTAHGATQGRSSRGIGYADGAQGFQQAASRFVSLLEKGNAEAAGRRAVGVPGPWEPVTGPREGEGQLRGVPQHEAGQRFDYARPGPYDYHRAEEHGANPHPYPYPQGAPHPPPPGGAATLEEGWERHGLPPPQPPPPPHAGVGPHAAAFQSLEGVHDDDLADLLLAWYYSGYYTGRYRAMQDARKLQYRRQYPPPMPHMAHGPPIPPNAYGDGWERQGWQGYPTTATGAGQPPASRPVGKRPGP